MAASRRSLRSVLALATIGLLTITVLGFAVSFELLRHANDAEREHLAEATANTLDANALLRAMLNQEVGLRGYVSTGTRTFLEPYEIGSHAETEVRARLDANLDPHLRDGLRAFEARIDDWHRDVAQPQLAAREAGPVTDLDAMLTAGKTSFDRLRAAHEALVARLAAQIELTHAANARWLLGVRVGAGLLAAAILVLALSTLRYLMGRVVDRSGQDQAIALSKFGEFVQQLTEEPELHEAVDRVARDVAHPTKTHFMVRNASKNRLEVMRPEMSVEEQLQHAILTDPMKCRAVRTLREVTTSVADATACKCALGVPATGSYVCIPMLAAGELVGVANFQAADRAQVDGDQVRQLQGYVGFAGATVSTLRLIQATRERALRDGLTGAYNRAFLAEYLSKTFATSKRRKAALSLLMIDLDHFKRINDEHGHLAGDQAIVTLARTLQRETRSSDAVVRYGGEEFIVVLIDADHEAAVQTAERIRRAVEVSRVEGAGIELGCVLRASIGVATFPEHADAETALIAAADAAVYRAKAGGRNRVEVASKLAP